MNKYASRLKIVVLGVVFLTAGKTPAAAQGHSVDVGATYTYVRTNLLPGCNCFGTQGGSGSVQFGISSRLFLLGDVSVTQRQGLTMNQYNLTQAVFTAGMRYFPAVGRFSIRPFGDLLLGGAHASGTLSPASTGYGGPMTFAFQTGGGIQYPLSRRLTLLPVQAEYLLTTFGNGTANRQNDVRLSIGVLFRIHR